MEQRCVDEGVEEGTRPQAEFERDGLRSVQSVTPWFILNDSYHFVSSSISPSSVIPLVLDFICIVS